MGNLNISEIELYKFILNHFNSHYSPSFQMAQRLCKLDCMFSKDDLAQECFIYFYSPNKYDQVRYKLIKTKAGLKVAIDNYTRTQYRKLNPKRVSLNVKVLQKLFLLESREYLNMLSIIGISNGNSGSGRLKCESFTNEANDPKTYLNILIKIINYSYYELKEDYMDIINISENDFKIFGIIKKKFVNKHRTYDYKSLRLLESDSIMAKCGAKDFKRVHSLRVSAFLKRLIKQSILSVMDYIAIKNDSLDL